MYQSTELVYETLLRKDIKCKMRDRGDMSLVEVPFNGKNFPAASFFFITNSEENDVAMRAAGVARFPPERLEKIYVICNDLNRRYRHAKFVVDPEKNAVNMEMDIPSRCTNVGEVADELLIRAVSILDAAYPELMRATWA